MAVEREEKEQAREERGARCQMANNCREGRLPAIYLLSKNSAINTINHILKIYNCNEW